MEKQTKAAGREDSEGFGQGLAGGLMRQETSPDGWFVGSVHCRMDFPAVAHVRASIADGLLLVVLDSE